MSAAAEKIAPEYSYWMNALAGDFGPVHDGDPQPGFYRKRTGKSAGYVPVAIWEQDGKMVALVDGKEADACAIWTFVCQYPILEEWYRARMVGQPWPDESVAVTASLAPPPVGHNNPPTDPVEILQGQVDAALAGVTEYGDIRSDEVAAKAQSLRSRLLELSGDADKRRESEKRPHLDANTAIDKKWQPIVKAAKAGADAIRAALSAHETRKDQERRAAEAKQREADEAERQEALKAQGAGKPAFEPISAPPAPTSVPEASVAIRGAYGRAAAVKTVKVARVVDQDKAYMSMRTHKELVELIAKLAQRAAVAGVSVDGVEVTEEKTVT